MTAVFSVMVVHPCAHTRERIHAALSGGDTAVACRCMASFEAGLADLEVGPPDAAVVDVAEFEEQVRPFLARLRQSGRPVPVVGVCEAPPVGGYLTWYRYGIRDLVLLKDLDRVAMAVIREAQCCSTHQGLYQALDQLAEYRSIFSTVVQHMPVMVDALDDQGNMVFWNRECERVTGYAAKEVTGDPHAWERFYPDHSQRVALLQVYNDSIARGEAVRGWEVELTCKDGSKRVISWSSVSDQVKVPGWHRWYVGVDVTERKRVEEALMAASRMEATATLAGGIAHDFNNLLAVILGNTGLVQEELGPDHGAAGWLREVENAACRAGDLARQLLAFAQRGHYQTMRIDPNAAVTDAVRRHRQGLLRERQVHTRLDPAAPPINSDPTAFAMLLVNLLSNAVEAMDGAEGGVDVITAAVTGDEGPGVAVTIRDEGHGMTPEVCRRAFEPFFTTRFHGRGLGLAAAHGIVQELGGTITLDSVPDGGTTVQFWVPAAPDETGSQERPPGSEGLRRPQVLLLDGDSARRQGHARTLSCLGYRVHEAGSALEGLERAAALERAPDLLMVGAGLPDKDPVRIVGALLGNAPGARLVLLDGEGEMSDRWAPLADATACRLVCPVGLHQLGQSVSRALSSWTT